MVLLMNNYFDSDIDNDKFDDLYHSVVNINRNKSSLNDRQLEVRKIIESTDYLTNYFSDFYNSEISQNDYGSDENNICKLVEMLGSYILASNEVKAADRKDKTYYINTNSLMKRLEFKLGDNTEYIDSNTAYVSFNKNNYKLDKKQKITAKDLSRKDFLGDVLRDYQTFLDLIDAKLKAPADGKRMIYTRLKHGLKDDQIISKDSILGVWGYNINPRDTGYDGGYQSFMGDISDVKALMSNKPSERNYDLWIEDLDFQQLIKSVSLNKFDSCILHCCRAGMNHCEIAELIGTTRQTVENHITAIATKIKAKHDSKLAKTLKRKYEKEIQSCQTLN